MYCSTTSLGFGPMKKKVSTIPTSLIHNVTILDLSDGNEIPESASQPAVNTSICISTVFNQKIQKFRETCRARSWRESSHRGRKEPRVRIQIWFSLVRRLQSPSKPIQSPSSRKTDSVSLSQSESASPKWTRSLSLKPSTPSLSQIRLSLSSFSPNSLR